MDTDSLRRLQEERLVVTLQRAYDRVPFCRRRLKKNGWATAPLSALRELQFTTKADLAAHDPHDWLAIGRDEIAEVQTTSGTSGGPTITFLTRREVDTWSGLVARVLRMAGVRRGDLIFTLSNFGMSAGGFA